MSTDQVLQDALNEFKKITDHLKTEYSRLQAGRASAAILEGIDVEAYGTPQSIKAVGNITVPDSKTIQVQPWDKSVLAAIEKAISNAGLGLNPVNDGNIIRIVIPALTEERRRELVKVVNKLAEEARISVRNARHKAHDSVKNMEKSGEISEDDMRAGEKRLQEKVDSVNKEIEDMAKSKESDIMTI